MDWGTDRDYFIYSMGLFLLHAFDGDESKSLALSLVFRPKTIKAAFNDDTVNDD
jgi:hypothetical protein